MISVKVLGLVLLVGGCYCFAPELYFENADSGALELILDGNFV